MYCKNCGNSLDKNDLYCVKCGVKQDINENNKHSSFKISLISFVLFVIVLLILGGMYLYAANKDVNYGWLFVGAMWLSILPLIVIFTMSVISIVLYLKNKNKKRKIETIFYILNWIIAILLAVPMFIIFVN